MQCRPAAARDVRGTEMQRREFLETFLAGGALVGAGSAFGPIPPRPSAQVSAAAPAETMRQGDIVVERAVPGRPHEGKVLAAIQPHSDDLPLFAGGTVAKLIEEGYAGYLIRTTNDEKAGRGRPREK